MRRACSGVATLTLSLAVACGGRTGLEASPSSSCREVPSDAGTVVPASCQQPGEGVTDCGAQRESCCTSLEVTGGSYYRTYTNDGSGPTGEADPATVSSFRLDKYDVTVGRFRRFVAAWNGGAGWLPPAGSGKHAHLNCGQGLGDGGGSGGYEPGWIASDDRNVAPTTHNLTTGCANPTLATWTATVGPDENKPVNCVNWYEAYAFCIWDGGFLPSGAEWGYAAAGGSEQREYPWGSTDPGTTNEYAIYDCDYPSGPGSCGAPGMGTAANYAPVGTAALGAGRWGQLDLAGNVFQWNLDDSSVPDANPCTDCIDLAHTPDRVSRGGSFGVTASNLLSSFPGSPDRATVRHNAIGFRCARSP